jgi:hypothetical protein
MSDRDLSHLTPATREKVNRLLDAIRNAGLSVMVTDGYRSFAEQDDLYAQGRTRPGAKVTNARGGQSFHNVRRAVDLCFLDGQKRPSWSGPWNRLGSLGRAAGLKWGGDWTSIVDKPHFENQWCEKHQTDHPHATSFDENGECVEDSEA